MTANMDAEARASLRHFLSAALIFGSGPDDKRDARTRALEAFDEWFGLVDKPTDVSGVPGGHTETLPRKDADASQHRRAYEIADEAMFELLISEGAPDDAIDTTVIGLCDEHSQEVGSLAEASAAMREAFDWLAPRGYVELGTDSEGEHICVLRRPGEDC